VLHAHAVLPLSIPAAAPAPGAMNDAEAAAYAGQGTPRASSPEASLLLRYRDGDDEAMDELMGLYQNRAFWVARQLVGNDEVAADVMQDAFVRLLRHHRRYDPQRSSFQAWFLQIVRNMAIDHLRKAKPRARQEMVEMADVPGGPSRMERDEMRERIQVVLDDLPANYRELIVLRDVEGISPQDIAQMCEADYGTTRWRIHNARRLFRKAWKDRYGDELP